MGDHYKYKLVIIGYGGCSYSGDANGGDSRLSSYSRKIETKYLVDGATTVDYTSCTNQDGLIRWSINGPVVNPNLEAEKLLEEVPPLMEPAVDNYLGQGTAKKVGKPGYSGLDEWPLDKWIRVMHDTLPSVRIGKYRDGVIRWNEEFKEPEQLSLFDEQMEGDGR